jgi:hypothetical protein
MIDRRIEAPGTHGTTAFFNALAKCMERWPSRAALVPEGSKRALPISADGKYLAGGTSGGGEEGNKNNAYVMKLPAK